MKNEFIPYEEALAMKELGFDEESCTGYYNHSLCHWKTYKNHNESNRKVTAPLYQQAFRWFSERYGLEGITQRAEDFIWYKFSIYQYNLNNKVFSASGLEYSTYEEAKLACLKKLIEIVNKNKDE
jgi:hypothetical protein